jgi:thiamine-monophosphate kinase
MTSQKKPPSNLPGEFEVIRKYFLPLAAAYPASLRLQDDAALLSLDQAARLVITADAVVAGVHFFADDRPDFIARKALRVNISDLAAKGAEPIGYFMTIALPSNISEAWINHFAKGLFQDQQEFGIGLLGGDTVSTPGPLTISITAIGQLPKSAIQMPQRQHAKPGDLLLMTGTLGDAALGLKLLQKTLTLESEDFYQFLTQRYWIPQPRLSLGIKLVQNNLVHAMMDISDGLLGDLQHICWASGVGAIVRSSLIPFSPATSLLCQQKPDLLETVLTGGDDYELLLSIPKETLPLIKEIAQQEQIFLNVIGEITAGKNIEVFDLLNKNYPIVVKGFQHF